MRPFIVIALTCIISFANAADIRLVTAEYPPFFGPGMKEGGPLEKIVTDAFAETGLVLEVRYVPWVRALREAQAGRADGLLGVWHTAEREENFLFSTPILVNELVLAKRHGEPPSTYSGFNTLREFRIGVVRDYAAPTGFDEADLTVVEFPSDVINLTALARGRVDLVMVDRALARFLLATELPAFAQAIVTVDPPIQSLAMHVALSKSVKDAQAKLRSLEAGLLRLRQAGRVQSIAEEHGLRWEY